MKRGIQNPMTDEEIERIFLLKKNHTAIQIANALGRSRGNISRILKAKNLKPKAKKTVFDWKDFNGSII